MASPAADLEALRAFLASTPLSAAAPTRQDLFCLEHSMTIAKALESFQAKRILSAPLVVSPDLEDLAEGGLDGADAEANLTPQLLGWIDTSDILRAFLVHLSAHLAAEGKPPIPPTMRMLELMSLLDKVGPSFAARPLVTVYDGGDRALLYQAGPAHSLLDVIRSQFLGGQAGPPSAVASPADPATTRRVVHRVAIFSGSGAIEAIISQLDVMRFLLRSRGRLGGLADTSLAGLGLLAGKPPVMTVSPEQPTLLALKAMLEAGVSGAAVCLAGSGEMIANISVSDVRAIQPSHLGALALPVCELLAVIHRTTYAGYSAGASKHAAHPFFQGRTASGAAAASLNPRPPPGASPTASVATTATEATAGAGEASTAEQTAPRGGSVGGGGGGGGGSAPPDEGDVRLITCRPSTTLAGLLELFLTHGVHRVYVSETEERPVPLACVSPTDVLAFLAG